MGDFMLVDPLWKYIHDPRETLKTGGHSLKGDSQQEEFSLYPKNCGTNRVYSEKFLAQFWI